MGGIEDVPKTHCGWGKVKHPEFDLWPFKPGSAMNFIITYKTRSEQKSEPQNVEGRFRSAQSLI